MSVAEVIVVVLCVLAVIGLAIMLWDTFRWDDHDGPYTPYL